MSCKGKRQKLLWSKTVLRKSEDYILKKQSLYIEGHKNERVHFITLPLNFQNKCAQQRNLTFFIKLKAKL